MNSYRLNLIFFCLLLSSCASAPTMLLGKGSYTDRVIEATRIIDNPRGFIFRSEDEDLLLQALNFYAPPPTGQPVLRQDLGFSTYEKEQAQLKYERDLKNFQAQYNRTVSDAAKIRQAAIKILGQHPSLSTFKAIAEKLFDSDPNVKQEALAVMKRSNAFAAPILFDIISSPEIDDDIAQALITQLYNLKEKGEPYLIEILANPNATIATMAAVALINRYPKYPNPLFLSLVTSPLEIDRYKAPIALVLYQNNEALKAFLTLANGTDLASIRAKELFDNYSRWVIPYLIYALNNNLFPNFQLAIINKLAQFGNLEAMPYLNELFSQDTFYSQGLSYAKAYGSRFIPYAIAMLSHPNARVKQAALEILTTLQSQEGVIAALPLINNSNPSISSYAIYYIQNSIHYSEEILAKNFEAQENNRKDYFIMQTLTNAGSSLLLYDNSQNLSLRNLLYIFNNLTTTEWTSYLSKLKQNRLKLELQAIYNLYNAINLYNTEKMALLSTPLVQQTERLTNLAQEDNAQTQARTNQFNNYLNNNVGPLDPPAQNRSAYAMALSEWPKAVQESNASAKQNFITYKNHLDQLLKLYRAISPEHQSLANVILNIGNLTLNYLEAFSLLNLKIT